MRLRRYTLWSIFGLFMFLALAVAWLWVADLGVLKPQIERWVSEKAGRDGVLSINDFHARTGDSDIRGTVRYQFGEVPKLDIDVSSDSIVFAPLMEEREDEYEPEPEFKDGRLIPDIAIPFDTFRKLDASLDIDIGELRRDSLLLTNIDLQINLQDGVLDIQKAGFHGRSGYLRSRARFDPADGIGSASMDLISRDLSLNLQELDSDLVMRGDIDISVTSTGNSLRALLGDVSGVAFFNMRGGRSQNNRFLSAIYGDLMNEIFSAVNPFYQADPYSSYECIIVPMVFTSGEMTTVPHTLIRTDKIEMAAKPAINLNTETLNVAVRTTPKSGVTISAGELLNPFIKVTGTLARPRLAVDEKGVLITGGAAVATGGLSILAKSVWDRMSRSKDPCNATATAGVESLGDRFANFAGSVAE